MKKEAINIGDFTEKVTWRQPVKTTGSKGNTNRSYSDYKTDFVHIASTSTGESEISGRMQDTEVYNLYAHYDSSITNNFQAQYDGEDFDILGKPEKLNMGRFLKVTIRKIKD